jgi:hypothetical protein
MLIFIKARLLLGYARHAQCPSGLGLKHPYACGMARADQINNAQAALESDTRHRILPIDAESEVACPSMISIFFGVCIETTTIAPISTRRKTVSVVTLFPFTCLAKYKQGHLGPRNIIVVLKIQFI